MKRPTLKSTNVSNDSPAPVRRRNPTIVLAALVPLCIAGWLVWQSADEPSGGRGDGKQSGDKTGQSAGHSPDSGQKQSEPLTGRTVVIDPGHNPNNREHPEEIARSVDIGTAEKECDTTGTDTESGYAEAEFTLDLARRVRAALEEQGAEVTFTHDGDRKYGPCVDERAEAGNRAHADAVVSLHADGAPAGSRGFHVILPASVQEGDADTSAITGPSRRLGKELAHSFHRATKAEPAGYMGDGKGLKTRDDLGGLNLSRVPKVFLECGNMRDPQDARQLTDPDWRGRAADGVATGIISFLHGKG